MPDDFRVDVHLDLARKLLAAYLQQIERMNWEQTDRALQAMQIWRELMDVPSNPEAAAALQARNECVHALRDRRYQLAVCQSSRGG